MRIAFRGLLILAFCGMLGVQLDRYRKPSSASEIGGQDVSYLDRRISSLENRLGSMESSLRMLEQQTRSQGSATGQTARDPETALLRSELAILSARLREVECGLVHLDERTLSPAVRESQKRTGGQSGDPCRLNPETPLQLSTRR